MMPRFLPYSALMLLLMQTGVAQEQQAPAEALYDSVEPSLLDNLPPGSQLSELMSEPQEMPPEALFLEQKDSCQEIWLPLPENHAANVEQDVMPPSDVLLFARQQRITLNAEQEALCEEITAHLDEDFMQELQALYHQHQYSKIWDKALQKQWHEVYPRLAADHALPVKRYVPQSNISPELAYSRAYLRLAQDLANGLVNPKITHPEWNAPEVSAAELFQTLRESSDLKGNLEALNAQHWRYLALQKRFLDLNQGADEDAFQASLSQTLKPYATHDEIPLLRAKLNVAGEGDFYDEALLVAVKKYQSKMGLKADGIVGAQTRALLNKSPQDELNRLRIHMERLRWLPQDLGNSNIIVNIPQYEVKMFRDGAEIYRTKSVVGRADRETPAFVDRLRHVVMSPTWTVPPTIMKKDKLPQLINNPAAFDENFEAVAPNGRAVAPSSVDWSNTRGYALRQKPGPSNALGRVKFLFPNKHAIYLHDTPSKHLFSRSNRAQSSGCVRIQDPVDFARILLSRKTWNDEKISQAMKQPKEVWAKPAEEIPIYLVYWTLWFEPELLADGVLNPLQGQWRSAADIYKKDAQLLKQYQEALQRYESTVSLNL